MRTATPPYGFLYDEPGDALIVSELEMAVVEKVFRMAAEGLGTWTIQARLHAAGVPAPMGWPVWDIMVIKRLVLNDLYKPRSYEEMAELLGPEALSRLEPGSLYGVQWHNRRKTTTRMVSEPDGNGGRRYRKRRTTQQRPREEWIAVPVPSSIPAAVVEAARQRIGENRAQVRKHLTREWELRGLLRCSCGASMRTQTTRPHNKGYYYYYSCSRRRKLRKMCDCRQASIQAGAVEPVVWEFVRGMLLDPERVRAGMERMIATERETSKGSPEKEARMWSEKLAEAGRKRSRYQEMAAESLITLGELRERLAELEETCEVVRGELDVLAGRVERAEQLERDLEALLEQTACVRPEDLDDLTGDQRNEIYRMLRLEITPSGEDYAMRGVFRTSRLLSGP
jgi:site-specific DNA recombinase